MSIDGETIIINNYENRIILLYMIYVLKVIEYITLAEERFLLSFRHSKIFLKKRLH